MATASDKTAVTSSMSNEAYELIGCFDDGIGAFVRDLAQQIAADRHSHMPGDEKVIAIEVEHVREAGRRVMEELRKLLKNGRIPEQFEEALSGMTECFDNQSK